MEIPSSEILNNGPVQDPEQCNLVGCALSRDRPEMSRIPFPPLLPREVMEMLEGEEGSFLGIC